MSTGDLLHAADRALTAAHILVGTLALFAYAVGNTHGFDRLTWATGLLLAVQVAVRGILLARMRALLRALLGVEERP